MSKEMKKLEEGKLGSWKQAVTVGTWQTRGWHSKNATFSIGNYFSGALLYYKHLCQKGRDSIIQEELYEGTSKSAEGYGAPIIFGKAKEECKLPYFGKMQILLLQMLLLKFFLKRKL